MDLTYCPECEHMVEVGSPCECAACKETGMSDDYSDGATILVSAVAKIRDTINANGWNTQTITTILAEMLSVSSVVHAFMSLPEDQRDEFYAAVFDAAIGNEQTALVNSVGPLGPDTLEAVSDALKEGFLAYMNQKQLAV